MESEPVEFTEEQRQNLRYSLYDHPGILTKVERLSHVGRLNDEQLVDCIEELGIDLKAATEGDLSSGRPSLDSSEGRALLKYSEENPAFIGELRTQLTLAIGDSAATVPMRVSYKYTPEWPYYDLNLGKVMRGWAQGVTTYEVLERHGDELIQEGGKFREAEENAEWVNCTALFSRWVLGAQIDDELDMMIEEQCLRENQRRLKQAGMK